MSDRATQDRSVPGTVMVIRIAGRSNTVHVEGLPGAAFEVQGGTFAIAPDGSVDVTPGHGTVRVTCAEPSSVVVSTVSGRVRVRGHVADVRVLTSSGRVEIERSIDVDVRTRSGPIAVGSCVNTCRVVTQAGTVQVDDAREVDVSTSSSTVRVGRTSAADVRTISGSIRVGAAATAAIRATSVSGSVKISVPEGVAASMRLESRSGSIDRGVPDVGGDRAVERDGDPQDAFVGTTIEVSTVSGSIKVLPA